MRIRTISAVLLAASTILAAACEVADHPAAPDAPEALRAEAAPADPVPAPLVTVVGAGSTLELWPYTSVALGAPPSDPVNLLFPGADVRWIRAALLMLGGDRTAFGFPAAPPFDCTWKEAMGANQVSYATASGWTGSAIQLECGDYMPIRFHTRLFPAGSWVLGNAHFEVNVPGTNEHEVLDWELAQQLLTVDLMRAGVLGAPPTASDVITPTPSFGDINPLVYNGLPDALKALVGGPPTATEPVPVANDGRAGIFAFAGPVAGERTVVRREFVLEFDQTIPKPFCEQGPLDWLAVRGPIRFTQHVVVTKSGNFSSRFHARGRLEVTPVNPLTGEVTGETLDAQVMEHDKSVVTDRVTLVSSVLLQMLLPGGKPGAGRFMLSVKVGPGASDGSRLEVTCGS
jgi:hypothetical protein